MSSIGTRLKKAREKKQLSIEQVSQKTKIHPRIVEAIEEDRGQEELHPVYIKGFLKSYASLVGLNGEELIHEYLAQVPKFSAAPPSLLEVASQEEEPALLPWAGRLLLAIAIVGALFLTGIGISRIRLSHVVLQKGVITPYPFRIPEKGLLTLKLHARDNTWVTVHADGRLMYQGLLAKGKEESWTSDRQFVLSLTDGGAVHVNLNRKSLGVPGRKGRPLEKIVMTREGWKLEEAE